MKIKYDNEGNIIAVSDNNSSIVNENVIIIDDNPDIAYNKDNYYFDFETNTIKHK